jgi:hypothetical protein
MPNYCNNVVEIRGPVKVVKALVDHRLDFMKDTSISQGFGHHSRP